MAVSNKFSQVRHLDELETISPRADAMRCFERAPYQYPDVSEIIKKMRRGDANGKVSPERLHRCL